LSGLDSICGSRLAQTETLHGMQPGHSIAAKGKDEPLVAEIEPQLRFGTVER
jgi:hypothetical protein